MYQRYVPTKLLHPYFDTPSFCGMPEYSGSLPKYVVRVTEDGWSGLCGEEGIGLDYAVVNEFDSGFVRG